jgi:hypothetical protein
MAIIEKSQSFVPRFATADVIGEAFANFFVNWKLALKLALPWWIIQWLFAFIAGIGIALYDEGLLDSPRLDSLVMAFTIPVNLLSASTIAVFWHRKIILSEDVYGFWAMRADKPVWRYLFGLILFIFGALVLFGCAITVMNFLGLRGVSDLYGLYLPIILMMFAIAYLALRLAPSIVSIAVDQKPIGIRRTWTATRGVGLRLIMAYIGVALVSALLTIPFVLIRIVFNHFAGSEFMWIGDALLETARNWIWGFATISLLTVIYKAVFISGALVVSLDSNAVEETTML